MKKLVRRFSTQETSLQVPKSQFERKKERLMDKLKEMQGEGADEEEKNIIRRKTSWEDIPLLVNGKLQEIPEHGF